MINILIAEDMENDLVRCEKLINELDFDVNFFTARTGLRANSILSEQNIDGALIDINMPVLDGFELAHKIRSKENYQFVHIIFVTSTDNNISETYMEYHNYSYIQKPYTDEEFKSIVKPFLHDIQKNKNVKISEGKTIEIQTKTEKINIPISEILYVELENKIPKIVTLENEYLVTRKTFNELLLEINSPDLAKCHRMIYANISQACAIKKITNKSYDLYFTKDGSIKCHLGYIYKKAIEIKFKRITDD